MAQALLGFQRHKRATAKAAAPVVTMGTIPSRIEAARQVQGSTWLLLFCRVVSTALCLLLPT